MRQYLDIVERVLTEGKWKSPVRKEGDKWVPVDGGVRTLACPNVVFSHDMAEGFPLLTTKKMAWKSIRVELEGFIKGITSKKWYQERGCKIWNEWANPQAVEKTLSNFNPYHDSPKYAAEAEDDLGPIYGYQWRYFNKTYKPNSSGGQDEDSGDWTTYTDQLQNIVDTLRSNPMDRRMVCSAWNPNQIHMMALPPCHYSWGVTAIGDELHLHWEQRSCDLMLGVPFNIASYALLLELLAREANLKAGNLTGLLVDCHIYENQIEGAKEQLTRKPKYLPTIEIPNNVLVPSKDGGKGIFSFFHWQHDGVELKDYNPHPKLTFGDVVV